MGAINFVEHVITARVPELGNATNTVDAPLAIRVDPLTGHTTRLIGGERLTPTSRPDLTELTARTGFCPFCDDMLEAATGLIDPSISSAGRIRRGDSVVVPNVIAYSEYATVALYDVTRHFVDLDELTAQRVGNLFEALVDYTRGVHALRPMWHSISANYLPPSGSSAIHPHAQSVHDDFGTTTQRHLVEASDAWAGGQSYWEELVESERGGPRWIGSRGRVVALTPWAPVGSHEVWALVPGVAGIEQLTPEDCADLGTVLSGVFAAYYGLNLTSLNWAFYGGGPTPSGRYSLLLRVVSRSNPEPFYRSDVTYFERLHSEAMIDLTPERMAEVVAPHVETT